MEDDWESVADNDVVIRPAAPDNVNKWSGEDVEDDVKDSWEDEEEKKDEEKSEVGTATTPVKVKPNKALKAKLAEEERLAQLEEEERLANMTPEEKNAEKLRLQKMQEESDLNSALETFGVSNDDGALDAFNPQSKEDFNEFGATLSWKISQYKESPHFPQFVDDLVRNICLHLSAADMKKVKIRIESLHSEKLKMEKQSVKKPAGKGKSKASLRTENNDIAGYQHYGTDYNGQYDDDYDDFM